MSMLEFVVEFSLTTAVTTAVVYLAYRTGLLDLMEDCDRQAREFLKSYFE